MRKVALSAVISMGLFLCYGCVRDAGRNAVSLNKTEGVTLATPGMSDRDSFTVEFPAVPEKTGHRVCLKFKAYLDAPPGMAEKRVDGECALRLALNGEDLSGRTDNGGARALGRGAFYAMPNAGRELPWWLDIGKKSLLRVFYGDETFIPESVAKQGGLEYTLDISDKVNFEVRGFDNRIETAIPNSLTFNVCLNAKTKGAFAGNDVKGLVLKDITIDYMADEKAMALGGGPGALKVFDAGAALKSIGSGAFELSVNAFGGTTVSVGDTKFYIQGQFSYPDRETMGFNGFQFAANAGEPEWKPEINAKGNDTIVIVAAGKNYRVERTLKISGDKILARDTIANLSNNPIGLKVSLEVGTAARFAPGKVFLGGTLLETITRGTAENPTVFLGSAAGGGLGVIAEDNVLRAQMKLSRKANTAEMFTENFGLDARKSYTLEWSVYPAKGGGYFDFINKVRDDWGVNFTIEGPFCFRENPKNIEMGIMVLNKPWFEYWDYQESTRAAYKAKFEEWKSDCLKRGASKHAKFIPAFETNLITTRRAAFENGETLLPKSDRKTGTYGMFLNEEQSAAILQSPYGRFADSFIYAADGKSIMVDTWYPGSAKEIDAINLMVQPVMGNARYKNMMDQVAFALGALGADGVYFDQSVPGNGLFLGMKDRCAYNGWDGHTVDLSPLGEIERKYRDLLVEGASARAAIFSEILAKGKIVVANVQPSCRESQSLKTFRFNEMENNALGDDPLDFGSKPGVYSWQAKCHLASPIILGLRPQKHTGDPKLHQKMITRGIIIALRNGLLYYYYGVPTMDGPVSHMFPFTPVALNEGFLVGKERVVTCVSGKWVGKEKPSAARFFDENGAEQKRDFPIVGKTGSWEIDVRLKDWAEIAIIETDAAGATFSRYDDGGAKTTR